MRQMSLRISAAASRSSSWDATATQSPPYDRALALKPNDPVVLTSRGVAYHNAGDNERAIADFTAAIALDPGEAVVYHHRAVAFHAKGDKTRALADFAEASRRDPNDTDALIWSASIHHDRSNWKAAVADATEALRRNPDLPDAYNVRGDALTQLGEHQRAIADLTETLRRDPKFRVAYINRGAAYKAIGRDDLALADYDAVTKLYPDWEVGHRKRAEILVKHGRHAEAIPSLTKRIEIARDYDHFEDRADAYAAMGEHKLALADYTAAIERAPGNRDLYGKRAKVYRALGDTAAAAADEEKAAAHHPDWVPSWFLVGFFFLGVLMSWTKAVLCIAAAVVIRHRWVSMAVAAGVGMVESMWPIADTLLPLARLLDIDRYMVGTIALCALAGVAGGDSGGCSTR